MAAGLLPGVDAECVCLHFVHNGNDDGVVVVTFDMAKQ